MNDRVSVSLRVCLPALIATFVVAGALRLNECDLFNPDSPRYLIYAQGIADSGEYRATDIPGSPIYSWRPPGLPLLLTPVLAIRPFDVIAAKWIVLLAGALLLWIVFHLAALHANGWSALLVTAIVASAPAFLVLSTEVLTEVPFTLGVLVVLLLLGQFSIDEPDDRSARPKWQRKLSLAVGIIALAYTPWLRTAGVALVAAVGIWSLMSRRRFQWLWAVAVAAGGLGLLAIRNKQAAGENYVGSLVGRLRERGLGPMFASGMDSVWFYVSAAPGLILPGLKSDRPWYAPLTLEPLPAIGLPAAVTGSVALLVLALSLFGMWTRRTRGGSLALLFLVIYCACLTVWPWRHERFVWPLVPVLLAFVPAGLRAVSEHTRSKQSFATVGAVAMLAMVGWQSTSSVQIVGVNRAFNRDRDSFHTSQIPGFYFSDWRRAGEWLSDHSPSHARVLTWHAAVGATSHRFQKRVQFETMTPDKLRHEIEAFSARYLVVPNGQFGDGFGWRQIDADPAMTLTVVFSERDVTILEVVPNRSGAISKTAFADWAERQLKLIEESRQRMPQRIDLAIRHATLLRDSGRNQEAIPVLRDLIERGTVTVRICAELGWLLFDVEEFADAARFLDMARKLPNAESMAGVLADGAERSRERLREKSYGIGARSTESRIRRIRGLIGSLKYVEAECETDLILADAPQNPEANYLRGHLHHLLGEFNQAESRYELAVLNGNDDARHGLLLLRMSSAIEQPTKSTITIGDDIETVDPDNALAHVRLASLYREQNWPGKALATLETATKRFPDQSAIELPLADLYLVFARPELALPIFESLSKRDPDHEAIKRGLHASRAGLRSRHM